MDPVPRTVIDAIKGRIEHVGDLYLRGVTQVPAGATEIGGDHVVGDKFVGGRRVIPDPAAAAPRGRTHIREIKGPVGHVGTTYDHRTTVVEKGATTVKGDFVGGNKYTDTIFAHATGPGSTAIGRIGRIDHLGPSVPRRLPPPPRTASPPPAGGRVKFCSECSTKMAFDAGHCPYCMRASRHFCALCNKDIKTGARFCSICGTRCLII